MNKAYNSLLILTLVYSCNNQKKSFKESSSEKAAILSKELKNKVAKPKYGFNSGILDSNGNLWFGSNGGGVYCYNGKSFENYTKNNGLCNNQVYSIIEDKKSNLWFGTQDGLCKYDRTKFIQISIPFRDTTGVFFDKVYPVISPNAVYSLVQDKKDNIWIGTGSGAYRYDGKKFNSHLTEIGTKEEDNRYYNWITSITEDTKGNLWFSSMKHGGVNRYDGKKFTQFMPEDGLSDDMTRTIYNDKSGKIWFGFNGNRKSGLTYYDGKSFFTYSEKDGLCNKSITAIYKDRKGNLWLGSGRGGLCIYNGTAFKEFRTKDGQTFDVILFIIEDAKGNVWFGGKNGLWKFDGEKVTDFTM